MQKYRRNIDERESKKSKLTRTVAERFVLLVDPANLSIFFSDVRSQVEAKKNEKSKAAKEKMNTKC